MSAEDSIEVRRGGDAVQAKGNVEVRRGKTLFGADSVELDRTARRLRAKGSVFLRDPLYRLRASGLEMDLMDETGTILDADVFIEENNLSLSGSRVEKFVGQAYAVEDGLFTTCLCEGGAPPWRIGAREIRLDQDGRAAADEVTFYVYDVPVLYLPYASFPSVAERATGLLFPSFGWSDRAGLLYRQPFFWAIDKSNDVTINLAVESKARAGFTGQYRTVLNARTEGAVGCLLLQRTDAQAQAREGREDRGSLDPGGPLAGAADAPAPRTVRLVHLQRRGALQRQFRDPGTPGLHGPGRR